MRLGFLLATLIIALFLSTSKSSFAADFGIFVENDSVISQYNSSIMLNITDLDLDGENIRYLNEPYRNNLDKLDPELRQNEDFYEAIGMFLSSYKSQRDFKIKLKLNGPTDFEKLQINYRINF